jgi:RNA polymerase sigma-70 factor (ECF subfamily)
MDSHAWKTGAAGHHRPARAVSKNAERRPGELAHLHQEVVYNCAFRLLGDTEQAADVTEHVLLSAQEAIGHCHSEASELRVLRLVTCACKDRLAHTGDHRSERVRRRRLEGMNFDMAAHRQEDALEQRLQAGILTLPAEERIVLVLADVVGLSYRDISRVMNLNSSRVCAYLSRARVRLRDYLLSGAGFDGFDAER